MVTTTKRIPNKQNTCDVCEGRHYHSNCKPIEKQQKIHDDRHWYEEERERKKYRFTPLKDYPYMM